MDIGYTYLTYLCQVLSHVLVCSFLIVHRKFGKIRNPKPPRIWHSVKKLGIGFLYDLICPLGSKPNYIRVITTCSLTPQISHPRLLHG